MIYNPIVRTTKCIRKYKNYLESRDLDESANVAGGEVATSCVPIGGKKVNIRKNKTTKIPVVEKAHTLLHNPNLVIIESNNNERELLKQVGLKIESGDKVHIVKDREGRIKSAMAIKFDDNDIVCEVRYVDTDSDSKCFKDGLARLATLPNKLALESNNIEVHRDQIREDLIVNDD